MGNITVTNNSSSKIYVSVTATGSDWGKGGDENWYTLEPYGGTDSWGSRNHWQVIRFTRSGSAGADVESKLGVPGYTVTI
ncbi:hypothetical protein GYMLUDRAFT_34745, partial [Collybiopsis luxurians FD-317 M1]